MIIAVIGESGSGKSSSIEGLNPKKTVIVSPINKPMPFKGFAKNYNAKNKNWYTNKKYKGLIKVLKGVSENMPHIKNIVIDDFQYLMSKEFMDRSMEKGYDKFTEIGFKAYDVIETASQLRSDLNVFFLSHEEVSESTGKKTLKTIGKMLDDKIRLEGLFTIVLFSKYDDGEYLFETQTDGKTTAKSPRGMFEEKDIPNDLGLVVKAIYNYYEK